MFDAIVIGARCAGAATAMLLARKGLDVLVLDRARFPSDIPHGHFIHRHGPQRLAEWGLLDDVLETGCPPVTAMTIQYGDLELTGRDLGLDGGVPLGLGPRRTRLDEVLLDAAGAAGAERREGVAVQEYLADGERIAGVRCRDSATGTSFDERAHVVVGADGRNSGLARAVEAPAYESAPTLSCWYFSYWSDVPSEGVEVRVKDERAIFGFPTNDDLFALFVVWPLAELPRVKANVEEEMMAVVDTFPALAGRVRGGRREERIYGATQLPNFLRKPFGPGWALVGDASVHKDPFMALGICDALRDAELLSGAVAEGLSDGVGLDLALAGYERRRNEATTPDYQANLGAARLGPPPPEALALMGALRGSADDTRRFFLARQGLVPPETFFNEENLARVMAAAG
jgi:2-polyprenyl-6-methoxyphenol hydroxylase-like FAD-dependent oxidoreductase